MPLDPDMPEPNLSPSPFASDPALDNCFGQFHRYDVNALETCPNNTSFMCRSLGYSVEEPEVIGHYREFLKIMYGKNRKSRVLRFTVIAGRL